MIGNKKGCVFCEILNSRNEKILFEDSNSYVIFDKNPFNRGHLLIVSKKHFENIFTSIRASERLFDLTVRIGKHISQNDYCEGVNIYQNNNKNSGTHIDHLHFHLVPVFKEDRYNVVTNSSYSSSQKKQAEEMIIKIMDLRIDYIHSNLTLELLTKSSKMISENIDELTEFMNRDVFIEEEEVSNWYNRYLSNKDIVVLAKTEDNKIVGSAHVRRLERRKDHCGKLSIIIDRNYRGFSVGTKVLEQLKTSCIKNNVSRIEAEPSTKNIIAVNFLMENGFKVECIQTNKLKLREGAFQDCYLMSLGL